MDDASSGSMLIFLDEFGIEALTDSGPNVILKHHAAQVQIILQMDGFGWVLISWSASRRPRWNNWKESQVETAANWNTSQLESQFEGHHFWESL